MANNKDDEEPSYSPDGKKIAYTVYNDSQDDIYTINAFGGGNTKYVCIMAHYAKDYQARLAFGIRGVREPLPQGT
jgi:hypothetical protein